MATSTTVLVDPLAAAESARQVSMVELLVLGMLRDKLVQQLASLLAP